MVKTAQGQVNIRLISDILIASVLSTVSGKVNLTYSFSSTHLLPNANKY